MTDRIYALTVTLDTDLRADDVQPLMRAIEHLRGVLTVTPLVADATTVVAQARARRELIQALWDVLSPRTTPAP